MKPTVMRANPDEDNYLLESRVRVNCMHGSVGGEDVSPSLPNPYSLTPPPALASCTADRPNAV